MELHHVDDEVVNNGLGIENERFQIYEKRKKNYSFASAMMKWYKFIGI